MQAGRPESVSVTNTGNGTKITRKRYTVKSFINLAGIAAMAVFVYYIKTNAKFEDNILNKPHVLIIFGIFALILLYQLLVSFINKTVITISNSELKVRDIPLPYGVHKKISKYDIKQLYVTEHVSRKNSSSNSVITFQVIVILKSGQSVKLVKGLTEKDEALFIEQEIERILCIDQKEVRGEVG